MSLDGVKNVSDEQGVSRSRICNDNTSVEYLGGVFYVLYFLLGNFIHIIRQLFGKIQQDNICRMGGAMTSGPTCRWPGRSTATTPRMFSRERRST